LFFVFMDIPELGKDNALILLDENKLLNKYNDKFIPLHLPKSKDDFPGCYFGFLWFCLIFHFCCYVGYFSIDVLFFVNINGTEINTLVFFWDINMDKFKYF